MKKWTMRSVIAGIALLVAAQAAGYIWGKPVDSQAALLADEFTS